MAKIFLSGNTYPVKDKLKALGCRWDAAARSWYTDSEQVADKARELIGGKPIYNSPPPTDLGTTDPAELAAKFGRKAVAGATVVSFNVYGLAKGDNGSANGTIHTLPRGKRYGPHNGKRFVQVARTARRYYSRDMLEDFDLFDAEPGGSFQWDGVEVEPTDAERAADEAKVKAKEEEKRQRQEAAAKAKAEQEERKRRWQEASAGLEQSTAAPADFKRTEECLPISDGVNCVKITLPDGRHGWVYDITGGDDWRTYFYLPADAAKAARLAQAAKSGITLEKARSWLEKYDGCHGADIYRAVVEQGEQS